MTPVQLPDIELTQNAVFDDTLELYQDDAETQPADLTGKTFVAELRTQPAGRGTLLAVITITVGSPATAGVLNRHIFAADIPTLPKEICHYDIVETSVERDVWFAGRAVVR